MKDDLVRRQAAITAIQKAYADTVGGTDRCAVWKNVGLTNALHIMQDLPSVQTEKMQLSTEKTQLSEEDATKDTTFDCISRQAAKDALAKFVPYAICDESTESYTNGLTDAYNLICQLPSAQPESRREWYMKGYRDGQPRWIPFKTRPLTDEEKEEYPYYDDMLDCQLPEDGQRILVNVKWNGHEFVQMDEYYDDDGSYLDSGYEIGSEATAWMPLPEPYKEKQDENDRR